MGAWADIGIQDLRSGIEGHGEEVIPNRSTGGTDITEVVGNRLTAAKSVVRRKVMRSGLVEEIERYDDPESMLDAIADNAKVQEDLHLAIVYAALHVHTGANRINPGGVMNEHAADFEGDLDEQVEALESIVPFVLGWEGQAGQKIGGGLTNDYDRYD